MKDCPYKLFNYNIMIIHLIGDQSSGDEEVEGKNLFGFRTPKRSRQSCKLDNICQSCYVSKKKFAKQLDMNPKICCNNFI